MKVKFDFEAGDKVCAFFALYAGLRMYMELKNRQVKELGNGSISIPAAEAFCMLRDLAVQHPEYYKNAKKEYEEVYKS